MIPKRLNIHFITKVMFSGALDISFDSNALPTVLFLFQANAEKPRLCQVGGADTRI